jgi:autotransporter-associated beta strand protein
LNNSGTISGQNNGTSGSARAILMSNTTTATGNFSISNSGTISSGTTTAGSNRQNIFLNVGSSASPSTLTLTNQSTGVISDTSSGAVTGTAISLGGSTSYMSANIANYGTISVPSGIYASYGISITGGAVGNTNTYNLSNLGGTISTNGTTTSRAVYVATSNTVINNITNTGTISSGSVSASSSKVGIYNFGTITTLNNLQGASGSALTYYGKLPTNYGIIINGASSLNTYGRLAVSIPTGSMAFGIYSGGISGAAASTVTAGTYYGVLQGFSTLGSVTGTTGTYGGLNYRLVADSTNFNGSCSVGCWNLVFGTSSNIQSGTNRFSDIGGSLSAKFDGGTLTVDIAGSKSDAFTVTGNNGVIDHAGRSATFSGNITDDSGAQGKITIANTGTAGTGKVTFAGTNTYSGGTEVQAGAALSISSANNLGSGRLALIGSSTVPATLYTTADMTISNSITVTGDPVFNVASGTTTTISAPITDGASAGDVVVSGGGTLALTAINTYTGNTTIDSGSTLVLSGNGSIATSGTDATIGTGVFNNGIFNVSGVTANTVSIGTNFTQSSTGTLAMNFSPTNNQKLIVTGTASLAGALSLTANSGAYSKGRYTLLSANRITGALGSLSTNLSSYTSLGYRLRYDDSNVYLLLTANPADTQQSLVNTASALQSSITLQNTILINSFTYDCSVFDVNGICISAGGRNTQVAAGTINNTSGLLIGSYRLDVNNSRVGLSLDQNLSTSMPGGTIKQSNSTPMVSAFGIWQENLNGTGWQAKVSAGMGQKDTTITRTIVGTSEPGVGTATMLTQGAQVIGKYGFALTEDAIVLPYFGLRYTRNNMGGYTEATSSAVFSPLTMNKVKTNSSTALIGMEGNYKIMPNFTLLASAGLERNMSTNYDNYIATNTDIIGLTPVSMNPNMIRTRTTASLGAYYDIEKNQRLGVNGIYRQEMYQAVGTTSVIATYTVGL